MGRGRRFLALALLCAVAAGRLGADDAYQPGADTATAASILAALPQVLTFKAKPEARGPNLTLADVIEQELPGDAGATVVQAADGPGTTLYVDPALVALKLRTAPGGPFRLKAGYTGLRVPVPARRVSGEVLFHCASSYLDGRLSGTPGVVVKPQGRVFGLALYDAPTSFRVRPPEDHPLRGYVELRVDVLQSSGNGEDKVVATVPVSFLVQRTEPRVFTTQAVNLGDPFDPRNLETRVVDTTFAPDGFSDADAVVGKVARAYIPAGRMLDVRMVDLPLAIRRGDQVHLVVRSGAIEIQTTGEALRDARVGESLPVRVTDSGQEVQARCVDADVAVENAW